MKNLKKFELPDSASRRVADSPNLRVFLLNIQKPTPRLGESSIPRLAESESRRLPDSPSQRVADSPTQRIGESFFDYEYFREFEAKIGTARKVV
jgi:hypothetical protein